MMGLYILHTKEDSVICLESSKSDMTSGLKQFVLITSHLIVILTLAAVLLYKQQLTGLSISLKNKYRNVKYERIYIK